MSDFFRLGSSHGGSYLECLSTLSGGSFTTHLGVPPSPSGMTSLLFHKLSSSLPPFIFLFMSSISIPLYDSIFVFQFWLLLVILHLIFFAFLPFIFIIIITILCFSLCPLKANLHTYLTTWLSSCLVGILFGFSPCIA